VTTCDPIGPIETEVGEIDGGDNDLGLVDLGWRGLNLNGLPPLAVKCDLDVEAMASVRSSSNA
jgi:hypothetical protein